MALRVNRRQVQGSYRHGGVLLHPERGIRGLKALVASQPSQSRRRDRLANFPDNMELLHYCLADWVLRHLRATGRDRAVMRATLDLDSFDIVTYGSQDGAEYNAYYREKVHHPLIASTHPYSPTAGIPGFSSVSWLDEPPWCVGQQWAVTSSPTPIRQETHLLAVGTR
jgi:hypothetical protein